MASTQKRIAVFIDAENVPTNYVDSIFSELKKRGEISFCRAYGDFSAERMGQWVAASKKFGISVFQQDQVSNYKNAADIAMVIGVMDILHWKRAERYYLVSNDGDFTPLANRIKSAGFDVIGIGTNNASSAFQESCNDFIFLSKEVKQKAVPTPHQSKPNMAKQVPKRAIPSDIQAIVINAIKNLSEAEEEVGLSKVNAQLKLRIDGFAPKNYGFSSISKMLASMGQIQLTNGNRSVKMK